MEANIIGIWALKCSCWKSSLEWQTLNFKKKRKKVGEVSFSKAQSHVTKDIAPINNKVIISKHKDWRNTYTTTLKRVGYLSHDDMNPTPDQSYYMYPIKWEDWPKGNYNTIQWAKEKMGKKEVGEWSTVTD